MTVAQLRIEVVDDLREIGRERWTALVERADAPAFYSYDFLHSVAQVPLTPAAQPFYLVAYDHGELRAALPVYFQPAADPFAGHATPSRGVFSHVWHCYDTRLLCAHPLDRATVEGFWQALAELAADLSADQWGLVNVALREPLAALLPACGVALEESAPRYRLPLAGGPASLDEHLAGIGRSSRRALRQQARRAVRAGARIHRGTGRDLLDRAVLDLCLATADKHAPGYYPPDALAALVVALGDACQLVRVELDGELLAVSLCLCDRRRIHAWAGGCRYPGELNWSPQYVLFHAELTAGFERRPDVLECGRRNDDFKRRYGLRAYPLGRAVQARPG
jgi:hypothetical protein